MIWESGCKNFCERIADFVAQLGEAIYGQAKYRNRIDFSGLVDECLTLKRDRR